MRGLPFVNIFDIGREHASLHVCAPCGEQDIVWMPVNRENGRTDRLLELFRNPPVVVRVE
jgi:hypothetical protein